MQFTPTGKSLKPDFFTGDVTLLIDGEPVGLKLPASVELEVVDTAPYVKGASATGRAKPAKLSTGLEIHVPEYIENGTRVRVSTETGEFSGRA